MIYLSIDTHKIKLLYLKKSILGQYEVSYFNKRHEVELLKDGQVASIDLLASAIKESITQITPNSIKEKDVCLILPASAFEFIRLTIPKDIVESAVNSFIKDKVRATLSQNIDNFHYGYLIKENNDQREVLFFGIEREYYKKYQECLTLLDLKINTVIPLTLTYFKLFEKTIRREKHEKFLYIHYDKITSGYLYDSFGPLNQDPWFKELANIEEFESILKQKIEDLESKNIKLNRLILSGIESDKIRQDTFTKNVGIWANLLKRIIPNFYQDYLKIIITQKNQALPFLELDDCFGAFIFSQENKGFSILKERSLSDKTHLPKIKLPLKEISIFVASFILSFAAFYLFSKYKPSFNFQSSNTATIPTISKPPATPTPSPIPTIAKEKINIKILNGSGTPGKASQLTEILKNKGYQETINGGNADNFDYEITEFQVKKTFNTQISVLKNDLQDYITSPKISDLDEKENADAIIIIGMDFK